MSLHLPVSQLAWSDLNVGIMTLTFGFCSFHSDIPFTRWAGKGKEGMNERNKRIFQHDKHDDAGRCHPGAEHVDSYEKNPRQPLRNG